MSTTQKNHFRTLMRFKKDSSGNFAVMFALCLFAIMLCVGAAVDYSRMSQERGRMQELLDSATLNAAISLKNKNWGQAKKDGLNHFNAQVDLERASDLISIDFTYDNDTIIGVAKAKSENYFMGLAGIHRINYEVKAAVYFPDFPIEVALVLDTTFSMSAGNKMTTLKAAAKDFVQTVIGATPADRKISIVPFAQYVNVGVDKMGSTWLDAADEVIHVPEKCSTHTPIVSQSDCTTQTTNHPAVNVPEQCSGAVYNDGVMVSPASCTPAYTRPAYTSTSQSCNTIVYGDPVTTCQPAYDYTIYWNGCVASRNYPRNLQDRDFSFRVPGPNNLVCSNPITPLTNNKGTLISAINSLTAVGKTYIPAGVAWGARTLSKGAPYTEAKSDAQMASLKGKKFLVLMTDGINVVSPQIPGSPLHTGSDVDQSDDYLLEACGFAKGDGIEIFTVSFGTGVDNDTKDLLRSCATAPGNYFHAETNTDFKTSFKAISDMIITLHLAL